ncbi:hypothetical protein [Halorussus lipolyticus]|uniref:hypothetical protein n=1 Tax=Halorussus lipolyticus TaxID=3034024 RepID=UPI0023E8690B|nr:hypothetical protein [Halorussus sp. DT80]
MAESHDHRDRRATREEDGEADSEKETDPERETGDENEKSRPQAHLRWVQLRTPRHAVEIGQNGRVLDSYFHEGHDAWAVLLETYEGEV